MRITIALTLCSILCFAAGCGKQDASTTPTTTDASKAATEAAKPAATAAETAKAAVTAVATEAASQADDLLKKAKSLADAQKYQDAANILQQLSSLKLTPEQQKLVDDLKALIQKALAKEAAAQGTKAVGDLLGGKK